MKPSMFINIEHSYLFNKLGENNQFLSIITHEKFCDTIWTEFSDPEKPMLMFMTSE